MLNLQHGSSAKNCQGISRRTALKAGVLGVAGLSMPELQRLRADSSLAKNDTACILLWLDGGPSHLETYDPKPDAPSGFKGPFGTIQTKMPGVRITDKFPLHVNHSDKMVFLRSVHHRTGDHFAGGHVMVTGRFGATGASNAPRYPGVGSYVSRVRGANHPAMPAYVGLPSAETIYLFPGYHGASYLGPQYNPFDVDRDAKYLSAADARRVGTPKWLSGLNKEGIEKLTARTTLLSQFDTLRRDLDRSGTVDAMDKYQHQAIDMILGNKARDAFDIDKEDPKIADRYGQSPWGRYTLMARRLVEAGVTFVTVDMPHWDDHSSIDKGHGYKLPPVDMAVNGLISDLVERGLFDRVLVVVMGEFGRTPRINTGQPGIPIPGRDHWGEVFSVMMAGGGLRGGQVIGSSNDKGEFPKERPLTPGDVLATIYHVLGVDHRQNFLDHSGRPIPILDHGEPIKEII